MKNSWFLWPLLIAMIGGQVIGAVGQHYSGWGIVLALLGGICVGIYAAVMEEKYERKKWNF